MIASNDINENTIQAMIAKKHQIDIFGIGTNLVTCQAQPALGMVYKVCEFKGIPRMKLSEETEKTSIPGCKKVLRAFDPETKVPTFDVLCLESENTADYIENGLEAINRVTGEKHKATALKEISRLAFANG